MKQKFILLTIIISSGNLLAQCVTLNTPPYIPLSGTNNYVDEVALAWDLHDDDAPTTGCATVDNSCFGWKDIKTYLARNVDVRDLWQELRDADEGDPDALQNYVNTIDMLVQLKATFASRAGAWWGSQAAWLENTGNRRYWNYIEQIAKDINESYDEAGLMRPLIQGTIRETMHSNVCNVAIPDYVIQFYENNHPEEVIALGPEWDSRYHPTMGLANFSINNIVPINNPDCPVDCEPGTWGGGSNNSACGNVSPDISRVEARMWFFYVGTMLIDRGFNAIWWGQNKVMGLNDPKNKYLTQITTDIRDYANAQGTFAIIQGESNNVWTYDESIDDFSDSTTRELVFDYSHFSVRPREIYEKDGNPINVKGFNDQNKTLIGCEESDGMYDPQYYYSLFQPECDKNVDKLAFIDKCHATEDIQLFQNIKSPLGCDWEFAPFIMGWDNGPGCYDNLTGTGTSYLPESPIGEYYAITEKGTGLFPPPLCPTSPDDLDPDNPDVCEVLQSYAISSVWGWDDQLWFLRGLTTPKCKVKWIAANMQFVRNFTERGDVFMRIPGISHGQCWYDSGTEPPDDFYFGNEDALDDLVQFWEPNPITENDIIVTEECVLSNLEYSCGEMEICDDFVNITSKMRKKYTFSVNNPDITSIYKWFFQKEDGTWIPQSYGPEVTIMVDEPTAIKVFLRQDNLGLFPDDWANRQVSKEMTLHPDCCNTVIESPLEYKVEVVYEGCFVNLFIENPQPNTLYFWTFSQSVNYPIPSSEAYAVLDLSLSEASIIGYCLGSYNQNTGVVTTQNGFVSTDKDCDDRQKSKIQIIPNPVNKRADKSIIIKLQDEDVIKNVNEGKKLEFYIIRSVDSRNVKQFYIDSEETQVDISDLERGTYTLFTNSLGRTYNENFIVIDDF